MSLIEVMIAVAIFTIGVLGAAHLFLGPHQASVDNLNSNQAILLAREGIEAVRSIPYSEVKGMVQESEGYTLVLSGNLEDMADADEVEVWFEWGVEGGSDFISTQKQIMDSPGYFSERVRLPVDDLEGTYIYRAAMSYQNHEVRGDFRSISIDVD